MTRQTVADYALRVQSFCDAMGITELAKVDLDALDRFLIEYFEQQYFEGNGQDVAEKLLAALQYVDPRVTLRAPSSVPRAVRASRGFKRLAPGFSRSPLPWVALMALMGGASAAHFDDLVLALLVQFKGYLRPSELLGLKVKDIIFPVLGAQSRSPTLLLAPYEDLRPSKTGVFDESVVLDVQDIPALEYALRDAVRDRSPKVHFFNLSYREYTEQFKRVCELTGVDILEPHLYSLRHGGSSHDYLVKKVPLDEVKRRGRWRADQSVRRYEKASLVAREVSRLPQATRLFGVAVEEKLEQLLLGQWRPSIAEASGDLHGALRPQHRRRDPPAKRPRRQ